MAFPLSCLLPALSSVFSRSWSLAEMSDDFRLVVFAPTNKSRKAQVMGPRYTSSHLIYELIA